MSDLAAAIAEAHADLERRRQLRRELVAFWESFDRAGRTPLLLTEYRCRAGNCLLLHMFRLPAGRFYYRLLVAGRWSGLDSRGRHL
jgi:hypothetical protein